VFIDKNNRRQQQQTATTTTTTKTTTTGSRDNDNDNNNDNDNDKRKIKEFFFSARRKLYYLRCQLKIKKLLKTLFKKINLTRIVFHGKLVTKSRANARKNI